MDEVERATTALATATRGIVAFLPAWEWLRDGPRLVKAGVTAVIITDRRPVSLEKDWVPAAEPPERFMPMLCCCPFWEQPDEDDGKPGYFAAGPKDDYWPHLIPAAWMNHLAGGWEHPCRRHGQRAMHFPTAPDALAALDKAAYAWAASV